MYSSWIGGAYSRSIHASIIYQYIQLNNKINQYRQYNTDSPTTNDYLLTIYEEEAAYMLRIYFPLFHQRLVLYFKYSNCAFPLGVTVSEKIDTIMGKPIRGDRFFKKGTYDSREAHSKDGRILFKL
jgi:hypothetical protein